MKDDPEFVDAVDCMVSYFYEAGYNASKYDTPAPLLHAQVAIIADKYDCASLYTLASTWFANTVKTVESNDWAAVAALVYDHTTTEAPVHVQLRNLTVAAVTGRPSVLKSILGTEGTEELLRSSADLATDLLLGGLHRPKVVDVSEHVFMCDHCHYAHVGSKTCSNAAYTDLLGGKCSQCGARDGTISKRYVHKVDVWSAFACPSCDGIHTAPPMESKSTPEPPVQS